MLMKVNLHDAFQNPITVARQKSQTCYGDYEVAAIWTQSHIQCVYKCLIVIGLHSLHAYSKKMENKTI